MTSLVTCPVLVAVTENTVGNAAKTLKIQINRLGEGQRVWCQPLQGISHDEQKGNTGAENHPAFKEVQESFGMTDPVGIDQNTDDPNAQS